MKIAEQSETELFFLLSKMYLLFYTPTVGTKIMTEDTSGFAFHSTHGFCDTHIMVFLVDLFPFLCFKK